MMSLMENCISKLSVFTCLSMTAYMTYLQFKYFVANGDLAAISYRKFNTEEKDEYPTITICLSGPTGGISKKIRNFLNTSESLQTHYRLQLHYHKYLSGDFEDHSNQFDSIKYEDVAINIHDGFLKYTDAKLTTDDTTYGHAFAMLSSFSNPEKVCYSKNVSYHKDARQIYDQIKLNSKLLRDNSIGVSVYLHQKGKLIRSFYREDLFVPYIDTGTACNVKQFNIGQIEVVVRRENSKIPCNKNLTDEDGYVLNLVLKNAGCVPTFWEQFNDKFELNGTLVECQSQEEFKRFADEYRKAVKTLDSSGSLYVQPCTQMMISSTNKEIKRPCYLGMTGILTLRFYYDQGLYREIINTQGYTIETLLGQVGGYVGTVY